MYTDMDLYAKVRRAVMVDAMSERAAARNFGISRKTVNKMVNHTAPPGYQRKDRPVSGIGRRGREKRHQHFGAGVLYAVFTPRRQIDEVARTDILPAFAEHQHAGS